MMKSIAEEKMDGVWLSMPLTQLRTEVSAACNSFATSATLFPDWIWASLNRYDIGLTSCYSEFGYRLTVFVQLCSNIQICRNRFFQ